MMTQMMAAEDLRAMAYLREFKRIATNGCNDEGEVENDGDNSSPSSPKIFLRFGPNDRIYYTTFAPMNVLFNDRLRKLEFEAKRLQYLMACLSTLGGSNYLCHKPKAALLLARQQEALGYSLGSMELILRARVFQAVNYATLGYTKLAFAMMKNIKKIAKKEKRNSSIDFVVNMRRWLIRELPMITAGLTETVASGKVEQDGRNPLALLINYKYSPQSMTCV